MEVLDLDRLKGLLVVKSDPNRTLPLSLYFAFFSVCSSEVDSLGLSSLSDTSRVLGLPLAVPVMLSLSRGAVSSFGPVVVVSCIIVPPSTAVAHKSSKFTTNAAPGI